MRDTFLEDWTRLGLDPGRGELAFERILHAYAEGHRAYHTSFHLGECFKGLKDVEKSVARLPELRLAIWYHDVVYNTRAKDNERRSASLAREDLLASGAHAHVADQVAYLVLATEHDVLPAESDARLLIDIDLGILGAPRERFDEYEVQIRKEYAWVAPSTYREKRAEILRRFIDRPHIYLTPHFRLRYEAQARENIARSLAKLNEA